MPINRALTRGGRGRGLWIGPEEAMTIVWYDNPTTTETEIIGEFLVLRGASARVIDIWKRVIGRIEDGGEIGAI